MLNLKVGLGERSYPIFIEQGCLDAVAPYLKENEIGRKYCIISDNKVASLYGDRIKKNLSDCGIESEIITFEHGEAQKHLGTVAEIASSIAKQGFDRKDAIIALGGGVAGDIAGFVASSYMRGIPFVQIPTSLLAQVDSSVGGKTGVDIPEGKNMVGAFYQPKAVFIDTTVLNTLEPQEVLGGLAEVIKYGVIRDYEFLKFLAENSVDIIALNQDLIGEVVYTCCKIKAEVVAEDEKESNVRRILNYGHTIGHAVEGASKFSIIHGLAVAIGMVAVNKISVSLGLLKKSEADYFDNIIASYGLPTDIPQELSRNIIKQYLLTDKKTESGKIHFVLPVSGGGTVIKNDVPTTVIEDSIS